MYNLLGLRDRQSCRKRYSEENVGLIWEENSAAPTAVLLYLKHCGFH